MDKSCSLILSAARLLSEKEGALMKGNSLIILHQIIIMFLLMGAGSVLYRLGIIDGNGSAQCSGILTKLVSPCVIINSFQRAFEPELGRTLVWQFLFSLLGFGIMIVLSGLVFREKRFANAPDLRMCTVFTNSGFMAIPLVSAMFGSMGVFLSTVNIAASTILVWTWGVCNLSGGKGKISLSKIFVNPGTIGFCIGLFCFLTPFKLPSIPAEAVSFVADLNTPLAMIVLGCFLAQSGIKACLMDKQLYFLSLTRLVLFPLVLVPVMLSAPVDLTAKVCLMIGFAAPAAVLAAMFAQMHHTDYLYATKIVAHSTLLSAVTMPLVIALFTVLAA